MNDKQRHLSSLIATSFVTPSYLFEAKDIATAHVMKKPAAIFLAAATLAACAPPVEAVSRDNSYYRPGFVNPNLDKHPLYHKNAKNVLENLSSFKALYVRYENCAWAYYGNPYANRYNDEENYGWDGDGGGDDNGGGGGEIQVRGCG